MRADMGKVLVERPRVGRNRVKRWPGKGYGRQLQKCLDAGDSPPVCEGIKRSYGYNTKHFNEHLGPLRRFLDANLGRPWDKIYSEICAHVDRGNVVQKHILTHLFDYVVVDTVLIGGEPCRGAAHGGYGYGEPLRTSRGWHRWYVCPKSGLLRKSKYAPRVSRTPPPPRVVRLNNKEVCVERDGRWELLAVARVLCFGSGAPDYAAILQRHIDKCPAEGEWVEDHTGGRYLVSRRVLALHELRGLPIPIDWLKR